MKVIRRAGFGVTPEGSQPPIRVEELTYNFQSDRDSKPQRFCETFEV